jgi:hypothetical protein
LVLAVPVPFLLLVETMKKELMPMDFNHHLLEYPIQV